MKVICIVDGYNLYHSISSLKNQKLKWVNPLGIACEFAKEANGDFISSVKFFTAPPIHKTEDVQNRYRKYIQAIGYYGVEVTEGKFKKKVIKIKEGNKVYKKLTHEEKESDVNIALCILECAYEKLCDKILVITNDSDISPAIRMALKKNDKIKINVITPPLRNGQKPNYDLMNASRSINKDQKGQVYFKTRLIKVSHLEKNIMPKAIARHNGERISIPKEYL